MAVVILGIVVVVVVVVVGGGGATGCRPLVTDGLSVPSHAQWCGLDYEECTWELRR